MTSRPEKLLVVKERYIVLADYDMVKAELLYRLDIYNDWRCVSIDQLVKESSLPVHVNTMRNKVQELLDAGLIEKSKRGRTLCYKIAKNTFDSKVKELQLLLVDGVVISPDEMASPDRKMSYVEDKTVTENVNNSCEGQDPESTKNCEDPEPDVNNSCEDHEIATPIYTTSNTGIPVTSSADELLTSVVPPTTLRSKSSKRARTKKSKFYDWTHYEQFTAAEWAAAKNELIWPKKENEKTLLIGAYLLGMHRIRKIDVTLATGDYNKYVKLAKDMFEFFTHTNDNDPKAGFNAALDWIKGFVSCPPESYEGKAGWPIQMCFTRDVYRQPRNKAQSGKKVNNTGTIIWTQAEREAHEDARAAADSG